jgi:alkylmercury lyase-like protein
LEVRVTNVDLDETTFDHEVRRYVYDHVMKRGLPASIAQTASALSTTPDAVEASFRRLADGHILVLQRGTGEILMANPFSAVPTPFLVRAKDGSWYGNCIWDAMGIPAMLKQDATIEASCGCCGTAMRLAVGDGSLEEAPGIVHFAIPAARWWDDIVFN